jgi:hypothetical protein
VVGAAYAAATGKPANIRVYWSQDITKAIIAPTTDGCDVCSISWGADEASWGPAAGNALEQAAIAATTAGMTVFAASGDNDSADGGSTPANVDLPASAPHVIGCGGTKKPKSGEETVWNDNPGKTDGEGTGGGFSTLFIPMPLWQANAPHGPGRMVPDVAANADPYTGYEIILYGASTVVGGTSAVAPLYAGLFASFGTKLGFITPELYLNNVCFNDITEGNNGAYRAGSGPDPCTRLGSPIGAALEERVQPAAIHASRLTELLAENAQLRATIAGMQLAAPALAARARVALAPRVTVDPRAIVYGVLGIASGSSPATTDPRPLSDWGYTSIENFEVLTDLVNSALQNAGVPYSQFVQPAIVAQCSKVGDLISAVSKAQS